ncbi:UDP-4-amino-4,6-dideoxy-N-acetyl-beta-L-altrosamine transaminase [Thiohalospira halophila DSM 15071]|uniref:UDP-4-amino-4,6-dideoxy-N-acetyl-beta-L-altrosamine transaminase n=1 Tax=Thiohalospira halophila DSM 15071 TaxID=1123397 RepID=A0A1I1NES3_9GAMM|nr:UDP-4-amino-4,6-dideoxy-N-acetyl-beta-L-altrosamine transaminase [Thiohalospira halophila]SFC96181.1 UDP-4-amino-4,6-dideoxy-N-acetyl-beta-L-altrosamine transaminase [Thiohalospira halophila DSM 15071]
MIPYGRQEVIEDDIQAVVDVLRSDFLTQGPVVPRFEQAVAEKVGAAHGVATNSATSALHIACLALDLGPGDWLWTSPITFVASANCGLYCGARVDFVDIDPRTYNMSHEALADKLAVAEREGRLPKVVVPVHFAGQSCDMAAIHALSERYGFRIIEDASHAIGGRYHGEPVGCGRYSDITVFSFHPVKIITTGEGGMAVTNEPALAERMTRLRSHGITRDPAQMTHEPDGPWYYQQIELGFNYRMTEMQAALGISQLGRLDAFIARRRELVARYNRELDSLPVTRPWQDPDAESAWHLYVICLGEGAGPNDREEVFRSLWEAGIGVNVHYIPVHTQPQYQAMGFREGDYPVAEKYYATALSLPLYPALEEPDQEYVLSELRGVLQ